MLYNNIGTSMTTSYLSYTNKFITDYSNNYTPPLWDTSVLHGVPVKPSFFTPDLIPPLLLRWYVDDVAGTGIFYFSAPVILVQNSSTLIKFYSINSNNNITRLPWYLSTNSNNIIYDNYNTRIQILINIQCTTADLNCNLNLAMPGTRFFVTFPAGVIHDMVCIYRVYVVYIIVYTICTINEYFKYVCLYTCMLCVCNSLYHM